MSNDFPSLNRVTLMGRVGRVKEFVFDNGDITFHVALATKRLMATPNGLITVKDWHNIVIPGMKRVKYIRENIYRGTVLLVEGRIRTGKYDQGTTRRYYQDVICDYYQIIRDGQEQLQIEKTDQLVRPEVKPIVEGKFQMYDQYHEEKQ